jgi:trk system potassium uptake protein TrkH
VRIAVVIHITGTFVGLFGPALLVPAAVAALYGEWGDAAAFLVTCLLALSLGAAMRRAGGPPAGDVERLRRIEGLAVVAATWLVNAQIGAIPFVWAGLAPIDAFFESMSGLTTTGATVLADFTLLGRGMFLWRSLLQWLGGVGVVALFVAVLPRLAIGGREMFFAEAAGPTDEKLTPQLRDTAIALWKIYIVLTGAEVLALTLLGMPLFDAVCNSMSTLAAGGFSPHALSISGYGSAAIEWTVTGFMFLAGANFALQYRAVLGGRIAIARDEELRAYSGVVVVAAAALMIFLLRDGMALADAARHAAFQTLSILTTTGFASANFELWDEQAKMVLLLLMFVGGCAGSAAGGPKVIRHILMARLTFRELRRALHPRGVLPVKLGGRVVPEQILRDVQVFMLFYLLTFAVGTALVVALGANLMTGITASIAALGNIGPGFGPVGPMGSFAGLHPLSKLVLTLEMWIGRLEVITVLVFFRLEPWRAAYWRDTRAA